MTPTSEVPNKTTPAPKELNEAVEVLTRTAVEVVFRDMLNLQMTEDLPTPLALEDAGQIVSSVGFVGQATGIIHLYTGVRFARQITAILLGMDDTEADPEDMINDAFAELGNVLVGRVKSNLSNLGWSCELTIPSILRGHQLSFKNIANATRTIFGFRTGDNRLLVETVIKNRAIELAS